VKYFFGFSVMAQEIKINLSLEEKSSRVVRYSSGMILLQIKNLGASSLHWTLIKPLSLWMRVMLVDLQIELFSTSILRCSIDLEFLKMDELSSRVRVNSVQGTQVLLRDRYFPSCGLKDSLRGWLMGINQGYLIKGYYET
jgi:hypothetical protein